MALHHTWNKCAFPHMLQTHEHFNTQCHISTTSFLQKALFNRSRFDDNPPCVCVCVFVPTCVYVHVDTHTHRHTYMSLLICVYMCECRWVVFGTEKSFSALLVCERSFGCVCSMFGLHPVHTCVYYLFIHFYVGMCVCLCVCVCVSMCVFV